MINIYFMKKFKKNTNPYKKWPSSYCSHSFHPSDWFIPNLVVFCPSSEDCLLPWGITGVLSLLHVMCYPGPGFMLSFLYISSAPL